MNAAEHRARAEELLKAVEEFPSPGRRRDAHLGVAVVTQLTLQAQVHATLALAAQVDQ